MELGAALEKVHSAVENRARFLAGKYKKYDDAEELRDAFKKIRQLTLKSYEEGEVLLI